MNQKAIRMITFHTPKNYGAVLQAYSLMTYLKTLSPDVRVIDFNTEHLKSLYPLFVKPNGVKGIIKSAINVLYLPKKKEKYRKFDEFVSRYIDLTRRYSSIDELRESAPEAEFYFTGSDQVFNPNRIEEEREAFYLNFGGEDIKRIAYAASFGVQSVSEKQKKLVASYLYKYHKISVREKSGAEIIQTILNKQVTEVMDPVFLNSKDFWEKTSKTYRIANEPYLLYYRLMNSEKSDSEVRRIAKEKKLKLIVMTDGFLKWRPDRVLRDVGPQELLYLIHHAAFVATDSFHGVAFSLIFEKQFFFCDYVQRLADRALNLLRAVGAEQCAGLNEGTGSFVLDYDEVNQKLDSLIRESKAFIEETLE